MMKDLAFIVALLILSCATAQFTSFVPTATTSYLNNGMSGFYEWLGGNILPLSNRDAYDRYSWRELEPTQGTYNFTKLEALLTRAKNTYGGKAGFRIMTADSWAGGKSVPDYFATSANGWTCTAISNQPWIPNWNGAALLTRLTALVQALATAYANDPRLGWVDIGLYGNYGEWHNAEFYDAGCFPSPAPNNWGEATLARKQAFINLITSKFPNQYLVLNYNDYEGNCIATQGSRIGLRGDTFSDASWSSSIGNGGLDDMVRYQFRAAPFISEFSTTPDYTKALQNAMEDHRTNVGNGNVPLWSSTSTAQRNAILAAAPYIGPRIRVTLANFTNNVPAGGCFTITLTFVNDGSARVYDRLSTVVQLRASGSTTPVWQSTSIADIRNVMPTNNGMASWTESNSFTLPETIASGAYSLVLLVRDPTGYRPNFYLAIASPNSDISYTLGTVTIQCPTTVVGGTTCCTRVPTFTQPKYPIGPGVNSWNDHPVGPLYTDFLMWGWVEELNRATGNVNNTSPVWSGTKSISFTSTDTYGLWGMVHACGINITGYNYVHFRMRAASTTSGSVFFYPYMSPWNNPPSVDLVNYGGDPISTAWKTYNIPLSAFSGLPAIIDHVEWGAYNSGATFYVDDIAFSDTIS